MAKNYKILYHGEDLPNSSNCVYGDIIVSQQPHRRTISYNERKFLISLPYIYFKINYELIDGLYDGWSVYVVFAVDESPNGDVFIPPLNNIYSNLKVCMPKRWKEAELLNQDDFIDLTISSFWQSNFNDTLDDTKEGYTYQMVSEYYKWENKSLEDRLWVPTKEDLIKKCNYSEFRGGHDNIIHNHLINKHPKQKELFNE